MIGGPIGAKAISNLSPNGKGFFMRIDRFTFRTSVQLLIQAVLDDGMGLR